MASRSASRTVVITVSVPSGTSGVDIVSGCGGEETAEGAFGAAGTVAGAAGGCDSSAFCPLAGDAGASPLGVGAASAWAAPFAFGAAAAEASSPSPAMMPIGVFTATLSVPSPTRILASTPSSTASTSMVALSVSISARMSPDLIVSPSFFSHLASLPCSMVGERAGMRMSVGI